jgi:formiminoglutamase
MVLWQGDLSVLTPGRAVLVGFPQDEGVLRNGGRTGAADAPAEIRRWLSRLSVWDGASDIDLSACPPVDLGNVRVTGTLEETQRALGEVVAGLLHLGTVPIVLGGGHETAFGHYLGYTLADRPVGIINIDAHLDVRPVINGLGNSGTPFRQALEHPSQPLPGERYVCLGAQPFSVARSHGEYARAHGCVVRWRQECAGALQQYFGTELTRLEQGGCQVYVTVDADAVDAASVPGVSAPNPLGLPAGAVVACARLAGLSRAVASFDVVEINPRFDHDGRSARWAALLVWHFVAGLAARPSSSPLPAGERGRG